MPKPGASREVLIVAPEVGTVGGIQRAVGDLVQSIETSGRFEARVVTVWDGGDTSGSDTRPRRPTLRVPVLRRLGFVMLVVRSVRRRPAVVVVCHAHLAPVAWLCTLLFGTPFLVWCHGKEAWGPLQRMVAVSMRAASMVVAGSRFTAERVCSAARITEDRVRVINYCRPGGVVSADGVPRRRHRVLAVARLAVDERYKGIDTLLYGWSLVRWHCPDAELVVVGDGSDRHRLERIADALMISDSVTFAGHVDDASLAVHYAEAGLFALPSRVALEPRPEGEGFGLVYVEAGEAGLAVVAGRGGGTEDAVVDGATGILVEDQGDPEVVANAIIELLQNPERAAQLGKAGKQRAASLFSFERFRADFVQVLCELSGNPCAE